MTNVLKIMAIVSIASMVSVACGGAPQSTDKASEPEAVADQPAGAARAAVIDHSVESLGGDLVDLTSFRGRPLLIVNTASKCGYTPQYEGLQALYQKYGDQGLVVIGFPSNDFGNQEPGSAEEIGSFCKRNYGVSFPMMAKVHTKGGDQAPIYRTLTEDTPDGIRGEIRWNFTKFLVAPDGVVVARFEPGVEPLDPKITTAIEALLPESQSSN
jgi:glutathione peroxidase